MGVYNYEEKQKRKLFAEEVPALIRIFYIVGYILAICGLFLLQMVVLEREITWK